MSTFQPLLLRFPCRLFQSHKCHPSHLKRIQPSLLSNVIKCCYQGLQNAALCQKFVLLCNDLTLVQFTQSVLSMFENIPICVHHTRGGTISNCSSISISIISKISFSISRSISILSLKNNQDQDQYQDQYFFHMQYQDQDQYSQKSKFNINTSINIFNILILNINILLANISGSKFFVISYHA